LNSARLAANRGHFKVPGEDFFYYLGFGCESDAKRQSYFLAAKLFRKIDYFGQPGFFAVVARLYGRSRPVYSGDAFGLIECTLPLCSAKTVFPISAIFDVAQSTLWHGRLFH
jgi:hypothetical protein